MAKIINQLEVFVALEGGDLAVIDAAIVAHKEALNLLADVMQNPEYLTDSYYKEEGKKLQQRYEKLCADS